MKKSNMPVYKHLIMILVFLCLSPAYTQHYIGYNKAQIVTKFAYNPGVKRMTQAYETFDGNEMLLLTYMFNDRTQYYYVNPKNNVCESYAAMYTSLNAKDSLVKIFDAKYKRIPYFADTVAMAWLEYGDGINYRRILRDFHPPACLVILAVDKKVDD